MIRPRGGGGWISTVHSTVQRCIATAGQLGAAAKFPLQATPVGVDTMKSSTTLIMITLLGIASVQASASPATLENGLTGVPMSAAKRLLQAPVPNVGSTGVQTAGVSMARAARLLGAQPVAGSADAVVTSAQLSGIAVARAKRT